MSLMLFNHYGFAPCISKCREWIEKGIREAGFKILGCCLVGSLCYGLELATCYVNIDVVLGFGDNQR